ncbi:MAG TPA: DoxX family protein [Candidatus Acidoferrales bacterium]|jgi:hypothetical protein|nr:DoxX family protein [Candidatus Acidoferrales bacterium]
MIAEENSLQAEDSPISERRRTWGNGLIDFSTIGLILSSLIKFSRLPGPVAYMGSLGYKDGTYFFVACLEFVIAIVFFVRATRTLGLLLVSSYLGGAISAHLANGHPSVARGPYMAYLLSHPLAGVIPACVFLASAWIGAWLVYPKMLASLAEQAGRAEPSRRRDRKTAIAL